MKHDVVVWSSDTLVNFDSETHECYIGNVHVVYDHEYDVWGRADGNYDWNDVMALMEAA